MIVEKMCNEWNLCKAAYLSNVKLIACYTAVGSMLIFPFFFFSPLQCFHVPYSALTMFISREQSERDSATAYRKNHFFSFVENWYWNASVRLWAYVLPFRTNTAGMKGNLAM